MIKKLIRSIKSATYKQHSVLFAVISMLLCATAKADNFLVEKNYLIESPHIRINLEALIEQSKAAYTGKIKIVAPNNIKFLGVLKTLPEKKSATYIYTALNVMNITPGDKINHQAFIATPNNTKDKGIIAVYLTNTLAEKIKHTNPTVFRNRLHTWHGYHIYDYSKGPAIVIENVDIDNQENSL